MFKLRNLCRLPILLPTLITNRYLFPVLFQVSAAYIFCRLFANASGFLFVLRQQFQGPLPGSCSGEDVALCEFSSSLKFETCVVGFVLDIYNICARKSGTPELVVFSVPYGFVTYTFCAC